MDIHESQLCRFRLTNRGRVILILPALWGLSYSHVLFSLAFCLIQGGGEPRSGYMCWFRFQVWFV